MPFKETSVFFVSYVEDNGKTAKQTNRLNLLFLYLFLTSFGLSIRRPIPNTSYHNVKVCSHCDGNRNFFKRFHMPLPSQCEHSNWLQWYPFLPLPLPSWMGIEPIDDGNGNDTKIMAIMPLPSQFEWVLRFVHTVVATAIERTKILNFFHCCCRHDVNVTTFCHDTHFFCCCCHHDFDWTHLWCKRQRHKKCRCRNNVNEPLTSVQQWRIQRGYDTKSIKKRKNFPWWLILNVISHQTKLVSNSRHVN